MESSDNNMMDTDYESSSLQEKDDEVQNTTEMENSIPEPPDYTQIAIDQNIVQIKKILKSKISSDNLVMENQTELIQLMKEQMKEDQKTIDHIQKQNIKLQQKVHDLKEKIKIKRTTFDQNMTYFDNMTQEPPISPNKLAFINDMMRRRVELSDGDTSRHNPLRVNFMLNMQIQKMVEKHRRSMAEDEASS